MSNLSNHTFWDDDVISTELNVYEGDEVIDFKLTHTVDSMSFSKEDVKAMAKHFKLFSGAIDEYIGHQHID